MTPSPFVRLFLVRHGATDYNRQGRLQGHRPVPLNALGRLQCYRLADRLRAYDFAACFASDLLRARQAAELLTLARPCPLSLVPALRERAFGPWTGATFDALARRFGPHSDWYTFPFQGAEPLDHLSERVCAFARALVAPFAARDVLLVTHGGPIRALVASLTLRPFKTLPNPANASLTLLRLSDEGGEVELYSDTSHLA